MNCEDYGTMTASKP